MFDFKMLCKNQSIENKARQKKQILYYIDKKMEIQCLTNIKWPWTSTFVLVRCLVLKHLAI